MNLAALDQLAANVRGTFSGIHPEALDIVIGMADEAARDIQGDIPELTAQQIGAVLLLAVVNLTTWRESPEYAPVIEGIAERNFFAIVGTQLYEHRAGTRA